MSNPKLLKKGLNVENIITNDVVRGRCIVPKLTVSIQRGEVSVAFQLNTESHWHIRLAIESIKEEVRRQVELTITHGVRKIANTRPTCATLSVDINAEQPELRLEIWDPIKFNANFDQNFEKLILVASHMVGQWCTNIDTVALAPAV